MTIRYDDRVSRLFFYWKGSLWQLMFWDLLGFVVIYYSLNFIYRFALTESQKEVFENVVLSISPICDVLINTATFLLGFFVNTNTTRWWDEFLLLPWPEELMMSLNFIMLETDEETVMIRRTIARYFCLSSALAGRRLSATVRSKYPVDYDVVKAGLMTEHEYTVYKNLPSEVKVFTPLNWGQQIVARQCAKRQVPAPHSRSTSTEFSECTTQFRKLFCYDDVNIPLIYTQCVALAVETFFAAIMVGRQFIDSERAIATPSYSLDYYVPVFTILQLIFCMAWFRIGFKLMKPFGEDAEDFEVSDMLDRHIQVAFELAEAPNADLPALVNIDPRTDRYIAQKYFRHKHIVRNHSRSTTTPVTRQRRASEDTVRLLPTDMIIGVSPI